MTVRSRTAFTLIELLIVVAIIAVLAAIAIPNYMTAQVRGKLARVQADFQALATAMECYNADYSSYPLEDGFYSIDFAAFNKLTSPIAYIARMPEDPFKARIQGQASAGDTDIGFYNIGTGSTREHMNRWKTGDRDVYVIASYGPDYLDNTNYIEWYPYTNDACPYDISNGVVSAGDIYRFSETSSGSWTRNFEQAANPIRYPNP